jgi:peptide deformylase
LRRKALKIVQVGDPVLRQRARALSPDEIRSRETRKLIDARRQAMCDAPGVGLAAPQIGLSLQIAVIEDREEYLEDVREEDLAARERKAIPFHVLINPTLEERPARPKDSGPEVVQFFEGCLSLDGFTALVPRARHVRVSCLDEHGKRKTIEASGWYARILQHEIDHLNGRLYIDRMDSRTFGSLENFEHFWKGTPVVEIRAALCGKS